MAPTPILRINSVLSLLSQLVCPQASPHTALLVNRSGAVIASQSVPASPPFPPASLADRPDEERARTYAAVATSTWEEERGVLMNGGRGGKACEPLLLETEMGRMITVSVGAFLLILVGSEVTPWTVLDKKIRLAEEVLRGPLERVAQ